MFPLQRGNELVFQFSNNLHHHQHKISEDLILEDHDSLDVVCSDKKLRSSRPKKKIFYEAADTSHGNSNEHKKKMVHTQIEKKRRQEMTTLHASLRSLLPLEFIKGKRSISDQINESVNYIKHLQKNIKELSGKRDELKKNSNSKHENHDTKYASRSVNIVNQNNGTVGIEISSCFSEEGIPLSKLLELVCKEGLEVVSCLSTKVNGRLLHSVQCEVNKSNSVDLSELRRKLVNYLTK